MCERGTHKPRFIRFLKALPNSCDHVLMLVVWKLDQELNRGAGIGKREAYIVSRRNFRVATGTDRRLRAFEKLLSMTTNTRIMPGIIGNVRKVPDFFPVVGG